MTDDQTDERSLSAYLGIGVAAASMVVAGGGIGFAADLGLGTLPIFVFVGLLVGIAAGCVFVWTKFRDSLTDSTAIRISDRNNDRNDTSTTDRP